MTNQAVAFWIETPLTKVNELISDYHGYARKEVDLSDMYNEDANDFMQALSYFRQSDTEALAQHVYFMDTSPREELVRAFHSDCGSDFVEHVLGYTV